VAYYNFRIDNNGVYAGPAVMHGASK
jgi:hypothetical protein